LTVESPEDGGSDVKVEVEHERAWRSWRVEHFDDRDFDKEGKADFLESSSEHTFEPEVRLQSPGVDIGGETVPDSVRARGN